jgi:hypothetical protein
MTVTRVDGSRYTFDFGGGPETIIVDGTEQPSQAYGGDSLSVGRAGDGWKVVRKAKGRTMLIATWRLSRDGRHLSDHYTSFNADGSPYVLDYVYERRAGDSGFAGTWVSTSVEAENYVVRLTIRPFQDGGLSFVDSASQFTGNMQFPEPAVRPLGERSLELMRRKNGGDLSDYLRLDLSRNLDRLTITPHAAPGGDRRIFVFDRQ